jgi:hypothetical protein
VPTTYSQQDLKQLKRPELWAICDEIGVHRFAKKEDLVAAISNKLDKQLELEEKPKLSARIVNDGDINGDGYEPWALVSDDQVLVRGRTYLQVLNSSLAKDFDISNVEDQTHFDLLCEIPQDEIPQDEIPQDEIPQICKKGLAISFICRLGKESLYAVNINGRLTGYLCDYERGSGRFSSFTMSPNNQSTVISSSDDGQGDMPGNTDAVSPLTRKRLLLTIR